MYSENFLFAIALTVFAGLSTGFGSLLTLMSKKVSPKMLAGSLGFSAGVMIYVSMVEIFVKAKDSLVIPFGDKMGYIVTVLAFFGGIAFIALIDFFIPDVENPHEIRNTNEVKMVNKNNRKLMRMGLFSALAIGIHNFPEGLATFMGAMTEPALGISIAVAIAIHNIPEGIAVSVPVYCATGSRRKAFWLSFMSGLSEPIGALLGYFVLRSVMNEATFGIVFASVAGIMVYISLDELLPTAEEYGEHHIAIRSLIAGMAVMALSLMLFV